MEKEVKEIIAYYFNKPIESIGSSLDMCKALNADSFDIMQLSYKIEKHFKIEISLDERKYMTRVNDILDLVNTKLEEKNRVIGG